MAVDMIRAGKTGPVKFGHAGKPRVRLCKLQSGHYEVLYLLRLFVGGKLEEATLLHRFNCLRLRSEWFHFHPDMLGDVGLVEMDLTTEAAKYVPFSSLRAGSLAQTIEGQIQSSIEARNIDLLPVRDAFPLGIDVT